MSQLPETVEHKKAQKGILTSQGLQQQMYLLYAFSSEEKFKGEGQRS